MVEVVFYAKPGCISNAQQKKLLRAAGHVVIEKNLLTEVWDAIRLRRFFGDRPVSAWFNRSAPAVKAGRILPESLTETEAMALLLDDSALIRRPLIQVGEKYEAGFDPAEIDSWIGLGGQLTLVHGVDDCAKRLAGASEPCGAKSFP